MCLRHVLERDRPNYSDSMFFKVTSTVTKLYMDATSIEFLKESYGKCASDKLKVREHTDAREKESYEERNPFQRDCARILYSSSFRRLQGKMQILGVQSDAFYRNRLTHSLEVSQIARAIATKIGRQIGNGAYSSENDLYVIEAAALAHDIGHPAFGHSGERVLDKLAKSHSFRFEGNAQNIRILRYLEKKLPDANGLNLTNRTLLAINKYHVKEAGKKFLYAEDFDYMEKVRKENGLQCERTLDVQIIDLADEIAYAVHDLEDALAQGFFNADELLYLLKENNITDGNPNFETIVNNARDVAQKISCKKNIQEYSQIFRKELVSVLTDCFINDVGVVEISESINMEHGTSVRHELGFQNYDKLVSGLKKITFECLNRCDHITLYEHKGKVVVEKLFEMFTDDKYNVNWNLLPPDYRPKNKEEIYRCVVDYIAGMMDTFAFSVYEKHFGNNYDGITYRYYGNDNKF